MATDRTYIVGELRSWAAWGHRGNAPVELAVLLDEAAAALAAPPVEQQAAKAERITIDFKQATELLAMFGGEPAEVTLITGDGHSGTGLYAYYSELPEEGAEFLGQPDDEATPTAEPAQPAPQAGAAELTEQEVDDIADILRNTHGLEGEVEEVIVTVWRHLVGLPQFVPTVHPTEQPSQDAELLDWVIRQGEEFRCFVITDAPGDGEYAVWGEGMDAHGKGKTAREAIDAARAAQAQGEKGKA